MMQRENPKAPSQGKRIRVFYVLEILKNSDANHPMKAEDIISIL